MKRVVLINNQFKTATSILRKKKDDFKKLLTESRITVHMTLLAARSEKIPKMIRRSFRCW